MNARVFVVLYTRAMAIPERAARANAITIHYEDGTKSYFAKEPHAPDAWVLLIEDLPVRVVGYDPPQVMRVLGNSLGTHEIGE